MCVVIDILIPFPSIESKNWILAPLINLWSRAKKDLFVHHALPWSWKIPAVQTHGSHSTMCSWPLKGKLLAALIKTQKVWATKSTSFVVCFFFFCFGGGGGGGLSCVDMIFTRVLVYHTCGWWVGKPLRKRLSDHAKSINLEFVPLFLSFPQHGSTAVFLKVDLSTVYSYNWKLLA